MQCWVWPGCKADIFSNCILGNVTEWHGLNWYERMGSEAALKLERRFYAALYSHACDQPSRFRGTYF